MGEVHVLKMLSICAALSFLLVSSAMAQSRVCAADIKKACANIEPGNGRIAACVKENLKNLSDGCKARLAGAAEAAKTCRADVSKECGSVRRRIQKVACVRDALTNLSDDCKATIAAVVSGKK
jgi:Cysteine rich repeat